MKDKLFVDDYRISYVFGLKDPFIESDLKTILDKRGFKAEPGSRIINAPPFRAVRADIAKRGNVSVLYDNETSFVGVVGTSIKEVRSNFDILGRLLKELDPIMFDKRKYVELSLRSRFWSKKDPQKAISTFLGLRSIMPFRSLFNKGIRPFSVRVVTEDLGIMDNPNWFELRIEPMIHNPRYYFVEIVYRNEEIRKTLEIADKIEEIVYKSIEIVEKGPVGSE